MTPRPPMFHLRYYCELSGCAYTTVASPHRHATVTKARDRFWHWMRSQRYSLTQIASLTGHHHTSVMAGIERHEIERQRQVVDATARKNEIKRERMRRKRAGFLARGLCQMCGKEKHRPGRKSCEECAVAAQIKDGLRCE